MFCARKQPLDRSPRLRFCLPFRGSTRARCIPSLEEIARLVLLIIRVRSHGRQWRTLEQSAKSPRSSLSTHKPDITNLGTPVSISHDFSTRVLSSHSSSYQMLAYFRCIKSPRQVPVIARILNTLEFVYGCLTRIRSSCGSPRAIEP